MPCAKAGERSFNGATFCSQRAGRLETPDSMTIQSGLITCESTPACSFSDQTAPSSQAAIYAFSFSPRTSGHKEKPSFQVQRNRSFQFEA